MKPVVSVVLRYRNGNVEKCSASPYLSHTHFSIQVLTGSGKVRRVPTSDLKAVFIVRDLESQGHEQIELLDEHPDGPKAGKLVKVTFFDGETMKGKVLGNMDEGSGFFLLPTNPKDNNEKIFVIREALKEISEIR